jgi:hypothetical protein
MHSGHLPPPAQPILLASTLSTPDFFTAVAKAHERECERAYRRAQRARVLRALVCTLMVTLGGLGWALLTRGIPQW